MHKSSIWFLEDLAEQTGSMAQIKLIEGAVVAAQSFIGELLFFFFSGKIIYRWGYGATMTFSLFCYGIRMIFISFIQHPWHLVFIEVSAAHVAPEGYSATVQGIVAGMDDGVGFALGSLVGGQLYASAGERGSFRILAGVALIASVLHAVLFKFVTRKRVVKRQDVTQEEGEKMLPIPHNNSIYRETVLPADKTDR
ncbi:unnamed protein product [Colias eurytheme]|nr:unnamed protein product [Colias eurytheme]